MIEKIISDGRPGSARAALEIAVKLDLPHGGATTKERKLKWGAFPGSKNLVETTASDSQECLSENIIESDGTLAFHRGGLSGDLEKAATVAGEAGRPFLAIDLDRTSAFEAAQDISSWTESFSIETLNVIGPTEIGDPLIHQTTCSILETAVYMGHIEAAHKRPKPFGVPEQAPPASVDRAVSRLASELPLKDRALIANMRPDELLSLRATLGRYIIYKYGLLDETSQLLLSCRTAAGGSRLDAADAADIIIRNLWQNLRKTHKLRIVKSPSS